MRRSLKLPVKKKLPLPRNTRCDSPSSVVVFFPESAGFFPRGACSSRCRHAQTSERELGEEREIGEHVRRLLEDFFFASSFARLLGKEEEEA